MAHRTLGDYKFGAEVEDVRGSRVLGKDREALGVIDDVIFDESSAAVRYAIVDAGKWLKSRKFVVPAPRLLAQPEAEGFVIQLSRAQIEKLPPFNEDIIGSEQAWKQYERAYHEATGWSEDRRSPLDSTALLRSPVGTSPEIAKQRTTAEVRRRWALFQDNLGKIGVVLSGGGARGAYEAGALLAFQDAQMPTHILAASSVGSINAAFYAAHSSTLVGNAEPLVDSWAEISSPAVGIDWSRYIFMLAGLVAATAGFFNALRNWSSPYVSLHADNPVLTSLALMFAGATVLLLYDQLPYVAYVVLNYVRGGRWKPDIQKAVRSLAANFLVWGFA